MTALQLAILMVAGTLQAEADNTRASREAVAEVIACRMDESGMNAIDVILRRRQFCCWDRGVAPMMRRIARWEKADTPAWRECKEMAGRVVRGVYPVRENAFNHFYRPGMGLKPAWAKDLRYRQKVGTQVFGRIKR